MKNDNKIKRCAIYTRKSTDEGLGQDFNSLDAQRMAAENYIASQKHEGWVCLPEHYDDGGYSGGCMERPALKKLLDDVRKGKIDTIVVYKVDRLSRSLMDFSRIIETLDKHNASFVSVTQHFNTTDSMGRLTLNILLSFAQFEREIISERTRDKMSMQRKLGKFTGGRPILGYDTIPNGGSIIVNPEEAKLVKSIFELYLEHRSVIDTVRAIRANQWKNKRWITRANRMSGGQDFTPSTLHYLLTNPTYIGVVEFDGKRYKGEHEAIIDEELFKRVQETLSANRGKIRKALRSPTGGILGTKLKCRHCNCTMFHTYTMRNGKKYGYYTCSGAKLNGFNTCPHPSLPTKDVEDFVVGEISVMAHDRQLIDDIVTAANRKAQQALETLLARDGILKKEQAVQSERLKNASEMSIAELANIQDDLSRIETELKLLRREIAETQACEIDHASIDWFRKDFYRLWEALERNERAKVIDLLIESIIFDSGKGTMKINYREHGIAAIYDQITNMKG